jgi:hypothetical protein
MKLLILLLIIPNVYCGITNNFTVLPNNTIYIAHTKNSVIYEKTYNSSVATPIVGEEGFHTNDDGPGSTQPTSSSKFRLYRPTSIINNLRNDIYFVNNDKYIIYFNKFKSTVQSIAIDYNPIAIANITTNASNNLYVANYSAGKSTIYKFNFNNSFTFKKTDQKVVIINEEIKVINYVNENINVITNKSYYKYSLNLDNIQETATDKIKSENNTNKLKDIQDFVIDENFEIGYIAFQERLKWFYF